VVCAGSGARARQFIKRWAATARAGPRAFPINAGAEAQTSSRWLAASVRASAPTLMPLRVSVLRPVQAPASQQRQVTSGSLPCGPATYMGGHARRSPASTPTQPGPNLGQGCVGLDASVWMHRTAGDGTGDAPVRSDQFGHVRTRCVGPLEMPNLLLPPYRI
jgi:hypothetical protein